MRVLILIAVMAISNVGFSFASCAPKPDEPKCKHPENVYTASTPEKKASYVDATGATRYCTKGHCKGKTYNACSESAELCCDKE